MIVRHAEDYIVKNLSLNLKVVIGQGQKGRSVVLLDGKEIDRGAAIDQTINEPNLSGKILKILTVVSDTNSNTNLTSVSYSLSGGVIERAFNQELEVKNEGDVVD